MPVNSLIRACVVSLVYVMTSVAVTSAVAGKPVTSLLEYRQRNVVMQEWDLSCGAAALTILLRYQHGLDVSEREVAISMANRIEYIENPELLQLREGFSLLDLKRYADSTGLVGSGFGGLGLDDLLSMAPVLVPVNLEGYNHFVVFRGLAGHRVLLADPAWGNRILPEEQFLKAWFPIGDLGRVGFTVTSRNPEQTVASNLLAPQSMDFVMLQ